MDTSIEYKIESLKRYLGVTEHISPDEMKSLLSHFYKGDIELGTRLIARKLRFTVPLEIILVSRTFNWAEQKGVHPYDPKKSTVAMVDWGQAKLRFGSQSMANTNVRIWISKDQTNEPFRLCTIIVHELSHVLLHSLSHPEKNSEVSTDLVPLLTGFIPIVEKGRKVETSNGTSTVGYLSDDEFDLACSTIRKDIDVTCLIKEGLLQECEAITRLFKKVLLRKKILEEYVAHPFSKIPGGEISSEDLRLIKEVYSSTYFVDLTNFLKKFKEEHNIISESLKQTEFYSPSLLNKLAEYEDSIPHRMKLLELKNGDLCRLISSLKVYLPSSLAEDHFQDLNKLETVERIEREKKEREEREERKRRASTQYKKPQVSNDQTESTQYKKPQVSNDQFVAMFIAILLSLLWMVAC